MPSLKRLEGYLMIDHRASPGLTPELERACGLPPGAGQGMFEASTYSCSHCQAIVILNPARTRERAYCSKCDRYLCDGCGALYGVSRECRNIFKLFDELQNAAVKCSLP